MITKQQLKIELDKFLEEKPKTWRKGQAIFNYVDMKYNVAREAQFRYGLDCFYNDEKIDAFIDKCVELINQQN